MCRSPFSVVRGEVRLYCINTCRSNASTDFFFCGTEILGTMPTLGDSHSSNFAGNIVSNGSNHPPLIGSVASDIGSVFYLGTIIQPPPPPPNTLYVKKRQIWQACQSQSPPQSPPFHPQPLRCELHPLPHLAGKSLNYNFPPSPSHGSSGSPKTRGSRKDVAYPRAVRLFSHLPKDSNHASDQPLAHAAATPPLLCPN